MHWNKGQLHGDTARGLCSDSSVLCITYYCTLLGISSAKMVCNNPEQTDFSFQCEVVEEGCLLRGTAHWPLFLLITNAQHNAYNTICILELSVMDCEAELQLSDSDGGSAIKYLLKAQLL